MFGQHPVTAALGNPNRWVQRLLATRQGLERLAEAKNLHDISVEETDGRTLETLLPEGAVHQGLAALCDPLDPVFVEDIISDESESKPVLILDQVTDPHNVGAILRSAAIFGAAAVIIQDRNAPPESGTLAKSASGALESVPLVRAGNLSQTIGILQTAGYWVVGLAGEAEGMLQQAKLNRKTAIVLGAEGAGLRRLTAERCDQLVRIPMAPNQIGSLNVSNAAAVALYELWRAASSADA
ncbi:23S rRNA (guanosine(2251)-2'-O)-methyltransferase RlmB [Hwanghaeella grinnelliae]|uniref:23S rRNA (Guanosine(2251)-2'-O)-methyltransferase RlmB n=1 Tax=Hwanghaeella grinnelliae TaxID=2500179 RepID=A0A3S2W8D0_9PROT|nr:23S rRNA (guanosine(2251)-2'-O)-methyltransferase RlmB [Hwanghaeella grinnelliae]